MIPVTVAVTPWFTIATELFRSNAEVPPTKVDDGPAPSMVRSLLMVIDSLKGLAIEDDPTVMVSPATAFVMALLIVAHGLD